MKMTLDEAKLLFPEQDLVNDFVGYIYVTFNVDEGLFYIGKQTRKDWCDSYYGSGKFPLQWQKEEKKLEHWPIQWCFTKEEINQAEFEWIDKFKNHKDIRNMFMGGQCNNKLINNKAKEIKSESLKGKNNPMYGKHLSEETKQKLSESHKRYYETHDGTTKGKKSSKETCEKISKNLKKYYENHKPVNKGQKMSEEFCKKTSESLKEYYKTHDAPMKGRKHDKETKKKMSERAKGRKGNRCKAVRCIETGEIFESAIAAAKSLGKKGSHIYDVCNGKREKALGYHWEWV